MAPCLLLLALLCSAAQGVHSLQDGQALTPLMGFNTCAAEQAARASDRARAPPPPAACARRLRPPPAPAAAIGRLLAPLQPSR